MLKTVLTAILTGFACFSAVAQSSSSIAILPREHTAEIQSKSADGYTESPEIKIRNTTENCIANAAEFGRTDKVAVATFLDSRSQLHVVQIFRAEFNGCPLYFGRVKNLEAKTSEPQFVLLGASARFISDSEVEVSYRGLTIHAQVERLVEELRALASSPPEKPARSLVLNPL